MPVARTVYRHPSAAETTTFNSGDLNTGESSFMLLLIAVTAVTGTGSPTLSVVVQSKDEAGNYFNHVTATAITATGQQTLNIGPGCSTNVVMGRISRLNFVISGTTPSFTFEA